MDRSIVGNKVNGVCCQEMGSRGSDISKGRWPGYGEPGRGNRWGGGEWGEQPH